MATINIVVTVKDECIDQLPQIVQQLQDKGLQVTRKLKTLGVITGSVDVDQMDTLSNIKGVAHISEEQAYEAT